MKQIKNQNELQELIQLSYKALVFIFKHSTICSISNAAQNEWNDFKNSNPQAELAFILVRENKNISDSIAEQTQVIHQSPQILLLKDGQSIWNCSHMKISFESLKDALKNA